MCEWVSFSLCSCPVSCPVHLKSSLLTLAVCRILYKNHLFCFRIHINRPLSVSPILCLNSLSFQTGRRPLTRKRKKKRSSTKTLHSQLIFSRFFNNVFVCVGEVGPGCSAHAEGCDGSTGIRYITTQHQYNSYTNPHSRLKLKTQISLLRLSNNGFESTNKRV